MSEPLLVRQCVRKVVSIVLVAHGVITQKFSDQKVPGWIPANALFFNNLIVSFSSSSSSFQLNNQFNVYFLICLPIVIVLEPYLKKLKLCL